MKALREEIERAVSMEDIGVENGTACPFHEHGAEHSIEIHGGRFRCAEHRCGVQGSAFDWTMYRSGTNAVETALELAAIASIDVTGTISLSDVTYAREEDDRMLARVAGTWHRRLSEERAALAYTVKRGLARKTIDQWQLGYAPASSAPLCQRGSAEERDLWRLGVLVRRGRGDFRVHLARRLVVPIRDDQQRVIGFGARAIEEGHEPKYLNSPSSRRFDKRSIVFGRDRLTRQVGESVLLVEGYMDVVSTSAVGIRAGAVMGTSVTEEQIALTLEISDEIIACLDGDAAGRAAGWRVVKASIGQIGERQQLRMMTMPEGMDPDDYLREHGAGAFRALMSAAPTAAEWVVDALEDDYELDSVGGGAAAGRAMGDMTAHAPTNRLSLDIRAAVARRLGLHEDVLIACLGAQERA